MIWKRKLKIFDQERLGFGVGLECTADLLGRNVRRINLGWTLIISE